MPACVADRFSDRPDHPLDVDHARERQEEHAVGEDLPDRRRDRGGQPGLAGPTGAGQGDQPGVRAADQAGQLAHRLVTADEWAHLRREQAGRAEAAQGREDLRGPRGRQLVEMLGGRQVLEPVPAEVPRVPSLGQLVADQLAGGLGDHDLSAVSGSGDSCGAMHVNAYVPVAVRSRASGVGAHAHSHLYVVRPVDTCQLVLRGGGCSDRCRGGREGHEEAVALGAHLTAVVGGPRAAQDRALQVERVGVRIAQPGQQGCRPLDVGEQEGDCSRG